MVLRACAFISPITCLILAGVLVGFGVHVHENYATNSTGYMCSYAYLCIGLVPYLFFIFLCIGYVWKNCCCIITFIILQILGFLVQVILAYMLTTDSISLGSNLANVVDLAWEEELKSAGAMSIYESTYNCCGRASPQDYVVNGRFPPDSCFLNGASSSPESLFGIGCRIVFEECITKLLLPYNIVAWVLIAMEAVVIGLSCVFVCNRGNVYY